MEKLMQALSRMGIAYEQNCPLAKHSTFRIGGVAELAVFTHTRASLIDALRCLADAAVPYVVVGRGSNIVFPDGVLRGAVVFTYSQSPVSVEGTTLRADAGVSMSAVSLAARDAALTGAEFAYGIPGTLGGAVCMNAGAYGGCMADICVSSDYFDRESGTVGSFLGNAQAFGYRTSIYSVSDRYVVLGATLSLRDGNRAVIEDTMASYAERRKSTQPLEYPSAGSVFKRPVGHFAGKLIEDCGLKGTRIGGAEVSPKHAGFIINRGGATAADVKALVGLIRATVLEKYGVELECEIKFL
ncbi:MAG: UDP-N-acetylmuramate dehydrogenase [Clostridia bacterium]|nr:UDP-N-acetylmuramate dehydrogenase [Clostridia bacterium]